MDTALIFSDLHAPYHSKRAWRCLLAAAKELKPKWIIGAGDLLDCYSVSRFSKDPKRMSRLVDEISEVSDMLAELGQYGRVKHYIAGNHEDRLKKIASGHMAGLDGMLRTIPEMLRLGDLGWSYHPYGDSVRLGSLMVTHDVGLCGMYSLRQTHAKVWSQVCIGHNHRLGYHTLHGKPATSCGWLGDYRQVDYRSRLDCEIEWCHGFTVARIATSGIAHLQPVVIINGTCVIDGKVVQ